MITQSLSSEESSPDLLLRWALLLLSQEGCLLVPIVVALSFFADDSSFDCNQCLRVCCPLVLIVVTLPFFSAESTFDTLDIFKENLLDARDLELKLGVSTVLSREMISDADEDGNGGLDFSEFAVLARTSKCALSLSSVC